MSSWSLPVLRRRMASCMHSTLARRLQVLSSCCQITPRSGTPNPGWSNAQPPDWRPFSERWPTRHSMNQSVRLHAKVRKGSLTVIVPDCLQSKESIRIERAPAPLAAHSTGHWRQSRGTLLEGGASAQAESVAGVAESVAGVAAAAAAPLAAANSASASSSAALLTMASSACSFCRAVNRPSRSLRTRRALQCQHGCIKGTYWRKMHQKTHAKNAPHTKTSTQHKLSGSDPPTTVVKTASPMSAALLTWRSRSTWPRCPAG